MLRVKFRQLSDLLAGYNSFTEVHQFLLSANVPSSLEDDIHRLEAEQPLENEEEVIHLALFVHAVCRLQKMAFSA